MLKKSRWGPVTRVNLLLIATAHWCGRRKKGLTVSSDPMSLQTFKSSCVFRVYCFRAGRSLGYDGYGALGR